jgi:hypothetical protein
MPVAGFYPAIVLGIHVLADASSRWSGTGNVPLSSFTG